jgi:hypothetical protein
MPHPTAGPFTAAITGTPVSSVVHPGSIERQHRDVPVDVIPDVPLHGAVFGHEVGVGADHVHSFREIASAR